MFWRLIELLLGLHHGFLSREGELSIQFNPRWPWQQYMGAAAWNILLTALGLSLVMYVYRRDGRGRGARVVLGIMRGLLLALLIAMLNRPMLTLEQSRTEPSVLAVVVDDSASMGVRDGGGSGQDLRSRLDTAIDLLSGKDAATVRALAKKHTLRFYRFDRDAQPLGSYHAGAPAADSTASLDALRALKPEGQSTQVMDSVLSILQDLQGQRVAGVVLLTDGRDAPSRNVAEALSAIKNFGVKLYPIALGSDKPPMNISIESVAAEDTAFKGDIVNVKATVRGTGLEANHPVTLQLQDKSTGMLLMGPDGQPVRKSVNLSSDQPLDVDLQWKPDQVGTANVVVEAIPQPGELDDADNFRTIQVAVLDAKISVLFVDGYPRWEYRFLKNELIRDKTTQVSCLLTSADANFAQEGTKPIKRFPQSIEELLDYDVIVIGDVDPRYFTDAQLQLIDDFVANRGGGLEMIAGTRWSPAAYRGTAIEGILPVSLAHVNADDGLGSSQGFRPMLTKLGAASSIFRFFADRTVNEEYISQQIQPLFWYCKGLTVKPGVGEVYAEHPTDLGPDGRKAPLLILGRYGAGRTAFSAFDESWRWRYYKYESIFDTYWIQQLRYLARSRKIGQNHLALASMQPTYEIGDQVRLTLRVLDPQLLQQLPEQISVEIVDAAGQAMRNVNLMRQEGQNDLYSGSYPADRVGKFAVRLQPVAGGVDMMEVPIEVILPRLELADPRVDRVALDRLALETMGQMIDPAAAPAQLLKIPSAAKVIPLVSAEPLWGAPLVMILFVLLLAGEWVMRKAYGMI